MKRKLSLLFASLLLIASQNTVAQSEVAVVLNEYSASNIGTPTDNYGEHSDWVEIYNNFSAPVSFNGYYLSNDRGNLKKWAFPGNYSLPVGGYGVVWLSGRNRADGNNLHANFSLEQCKGQWLILSYSSGGSSLSIRDSVFVQKTQAGHSRGRVDYSGIGVKRWKLYSAHSFMQPNPPSNNYIGYSPMPLMVEYPVSVPPPANAGAGSFVDNPATMVYFKLPGDTLAYDVLTSCYYIYYTLDGSIPTAAGSPQYVDSTGGIMIDDTKIIRAISVPKDTGVCSLVGQGYLPGFIETNTYFNLSMITNENGRTVPKDFGVLSLAIDPADTAWFISNGIPANTMIHAEYYDKNMQVTEGYAFMNRPPQESWKTTQKGFYLNIDDRYGFGCNFEGNIFNVEGLGTSSRTVFPTLHVYAGDVESESVPYYNPNGDPPKGTGVRDVFVQSLAVKYNLTNVNPLHVKPILVFKNGMYWGTFTFKEVYDKYYENFYHNQPLDGQDLCFYYGQDAYVSYPDGSVSRTALPATDYRKKVFDVANTKPLTVSPTYPSNPYYNSIMELLDKNSLIDYIAINGFMMNSDLWNYNVGYGKGASTAAAGNKWHYYLWNMPAILNFSTVANNSVVYPNPYFGTCSIMFGSAYNVSPLAGNSPGMIMKNLMDPYKGNIPFQKEFKLRYQDLLNGPLQCDNLLKHFDYVYELYKQGMNYHEVAGAFASTDESYARWDTCMAVLRQVLEKRCDAVGKNNGTGASDCLGSTTYPISIDVQPEGAGAVKLNSRVLSNYVWNGNYFDQATLSFKAIPSSSNFVFDHWEFKNNHDINNNRPASMDSVAIDFYKNEEVIAWFTDKTLDIGSNGDGSNVPTGFSPNGDGLNDIFRPLGSAPYTSEYEMTIWNRWGQEIFRSTDPTVGWDGTHHGQAAPTGVYAYLIRYKNFYGEPKTTKGNVTLTR